MGQEDLSAAQAKDHLQMVDRILSRTEAANGVSGWPFVVWGAYGAASNGVAQLAAGGSHISGNVWLAGEVLVVVAISLFFIIQGVSGMRNRERLGLIDRHIGTIFMIGWVVAWVTTLMAGNIFGNWALSAIWSLIYGITMMSCAAMLRSKVMFGGGVILIASIVLANYSYHLAGCFLGLGFLVGMGGTGLLLLTGRR